MSFKYKVVERAFRGALLSPGESYESNEALVSRALEPADQPTRVAVQARAREIERERGQPVRLSCEESLAILKENEELKKEADAMARRLATRAADAGRKVGAAHAA
jgi:hypothetical protein